MSIVFDGNWLRTSEGHLKTQDQAKELLKTTARALASNREIEFRIWCGAAEGRAGACVLEVYKADHQVEKLDNQAQNTAAERIHLTMFLRPIDWTFRNQDERELKHGMFPFAFHLYATVHPSQMKRGGYWLEPTRLSYDRPVKKGDRLEKFRVAINISNAGSIASERTA